MEIIKSSSQLTTQEQSILNITLSELTKISALKCIVIPETSYQAWFEQIRKDITNDLIDDTDVIEGFNYLLKEKTFGALDYAVFFTGAIQRKAIEAWNRCLSSGNDIRLELTDREKTAFNLLGGFKVLDCGGNIDILRKEFIEIYKNLYL